MKWCIIDTLSRWTNYNLCYKSIGIPLVWCLDAFVVDSTFSRRGTITLDQSHPFLPYLEEIQGGKLDTWFGLSKDNIYKKYIYIYLFIYLFNEIVKRPLLVDFRLQMTHSRNREVEKYAGHYLLGHVPIIAQILRTCMLLVSLIF